MKDAIAIDLDGTLSDCSARRYLVEGKHRDYEAFHARSGEDPISEWCKTLMEVFWNAGAFIVIVSARPKSCRENTIKWLEKHQVKYDELVLVREDGDSTPDQDLKRGWLHGFGKERVIFVVDDRPKVVKMWREEGVTCLHCAPWESGQQI